MKFVKGGIYSIKKERDPCGVQGCDCHHVAGIIEVFEVTENGIHFTSVSKIVKGQRVKHNAEVRFLSFTQIKDSRTYLELLNSKTKKLIWGL